MNQQGGWLMVDGSVTDFSSDQSGSDQQVSVGQFF